jgi:hypothetical protein
MCIYIHIYTYTCIYVLHGTKNEHLDFLWPRKQNLSIYFQYPQNKVGKKMQKALELQNGIDLEYDNSSEGKCISKTEYCRLRFCLNS